MRQTTKVTKPPCALKGKAILDTSEKTWVTFYFEGNSAWGLIDGPEKWQRIKSQWNGDSCLGAKRGGTKELNGRPLFGYGKDFTGPETLGEWAEKQGMIL